MRLAAPDEEKRLRPTHADSGAFAQTGISERAEASGYASASASLRRRVVGGLVLRRRDGSPLAHPARRARRRNMRTATMAAETLSTRRR